MSFVKLWNNNEYDQLLHTTHHDTVTQDLHVISAE